MFAQRKGEALYSQKLGFTLTELLTVVVIVGVLSAVALPSLLGQRRKAKLTECNSKIASTLKQAHADFQLKGSEDDAINAAISANSQSNKIGAFVYSIYRIDGANTNAVAVSTAATDLNPANILFVGAEPSAGAPQPDQDLINASTTTPLTNGKLFGCINLETGKIDIENNLKDNIFANADGTGATPSIAGLDCI